MSSGDAMVIIIVVYICELVFKDKAFKDMRTFWLFYFLCNLQNVIISYFLRDRVLGQRISIAPLTPIKTKNGFVQLQQPWIIFPIIIYPLISNNYL